MRLFHRNYGIEMHDVEAGESQIQSDNWRSRRSAQAYANYLNEQVRNSILRSGPAGPFLNIAHYRVVRIS